ncbi:O-antigen ligase family protein [candidate division WOR-3 bacterium]|nr:O-antigen ligase family protein [candidate division WOR-3 bacterium]
MKSTSNRFEGVIEKGILVFIFFIPILSPLAVLAAFIALIFFLIKWKNIVTFRPKIFWFAMFLLLFVTILSAVFSIQKGVSFGRFPFYVLSFLLCLMVSCSNKNIDKILKVFIISGIIVTAFGIIQYLINYNIKIRTDLFSITISTEKGATSTLSNRNRFAQYLILLLPLAVVSIYKLKDLRWKILSISLVVFSIICIVFTNSFAALSAVLILTLLVILIKNWKIGVVIILFFSIIYVTNSKRFNRFADRFTSESSIQTRFNTWKVALSAFEKKPITGCGLSTYYKIAKDYKGDEKIMHGHAHSMYIQLLCETGILGFTAFLFLMLLFIWFCFKRGSPVSFACAFSIIGALLVGLTGTVFEFLPLAVLFWTIVGIGIRVD